MGNVRVRGRAKSRLIRSLCAVGLGLGANPVWIVSAHADEAHRAGEARVLSEPAEITQVADAFDDQDLIDVSLSVGFQQSWSHANIRREGYGSGGATGNYLSDSAAVARYSERTSRLNTRLDLGVFRDVAVYLRIPIILAHSRELSSLEGSADRLGEVARGAPGEQLFALPFKSPTRSGIEYLALGLDVGLLSQARNPSHPTWVVGFEGRFNVSEPMHACNAKAADGQVACAHPSDYNRNGAAGDSLGADGNPLEGASSSSRAPGVSRGTNAIEAHMAWSKRVKTIEPYGGFRLLFELPLSSSDYGSAGSGVLVNHPPARGTMILGMAVIPWEIREQHQRITLDARFTGTYVSEGRDYSPLFDALGSSPAASLRRPLPSRYIDSGGQSVADPAAEKIYFNGITDVQQHGEYNLSAQFTWQAGEYIKFNVGGGYLWIQSHYLAFDQACNPKFADRASAAGPCQSNGVATGIPNPNYRREINSPGNRFRVDGMNGLEAWLNATLMF